MKLLLCLSIVHCDIPDNLPLPQRRQQRTVVEVTTTFSHRTSIKLSLQRVVLSFNFHHS